MPRSQPTILDNKMTKYEAINPTEEHHTKPDQNQPFLITGAILQPTQTKNTNPTTLRVKNTIFSILNNFGNQI